MSFKFLFLDNSPIDWLAVNLMEKSELLDLCENAHIQAGLGSVDMVHAKSEYGILKLSDSKYRNMCIEMLKCVAVPEYDLRSTRRPHFVSPDGGIIESKCDIFYLTQGTRPCTVLYLKRLEKEKGPKKEKVFVLWKLIGGLLMAPERSKIMLEKSLSLDRGKNAMKILRKDFNADKTLLRSPHSSDEKARAIKDASADKILLENLYSPYSNKNKPKTLNRTTSANKIFPKKLPSLDNVTRGTKTSPEELRKNVLIKNGVNKLKHTENEIPLELLYP